jgi:radical SAM protein with 4Fe4S-binding SPASM domain
MHLTDQIEDLRVPDEIVLFRSGSHRLGLNSLLASWAPLTPEQDELLCALAGGTGPRYQEVLARPRRDLARDLAHLVLHYLVYLPDWDPQPGVPDVDLKVVYYAITDGCNLRCPYCYASSEKALPGELTHEQSLRLMDEIAECGATTVIFTGGEPMLRKDLFDVVRYARSQGLRTNIITNGTTIRKAETARIMSEIFDLVTMSIDGGTAEQHEVTRGRGTFAKTMKALKLLNDAGVEPVINHVVSADNVDKLDDVARIGAQYKIKQIRMMQHSDLGRAKEDDMDFGWREYMKTHVYMWTHPNAKHLMADNTLDSLKPCRIKGNCGMGGNEIYINSLGNVYPCKLVTGIGELAGNVKNTSLRDIFNAPLLKDMRDSTVFGGSLHTDCERCYIKGACGGGCRAYHMAQSGDIHKNSRHFCRILRHTQVSTMWAAVGLGKEILVEDPGAYVPFRPHDGSVHPVYEDWRHEPVRDAPVSPAVPSSARMSLPIVGVSS